MIDRTILCLGVHIGSATPTGPSWRGLSKEKRREGLFCFVFQDRVCLCSLGCLGTMSDLHPGLELTVLTLECSDQKRAPPLLDKPSKF